ncbi:MAG: flagellar basal body P-ring formation protein FlgA [Zoogloeaceae bacterium]|jgi:flagella basal body P-ring formation protein FlgA|nr:flagellar basal body P-ring formation protein FlgA [Zoogloeaceae bacterium]
MPRLACFFFFLCLLFLPARAANDPLLQKVEDFVRDELRDQPGLRSVVAGPLDSRLRLPACDTLQPFLPNAATRLAGQTNIGLRCLGPSRWSIFVPVIIAIDRPYLAAVTALPAGHILREGDVVVQMGDAAGLPASALRDPAEALGKTLKISLRAGQPLRQELLTMPLIVQQGQNVRLIFHGEGFTATNEGKALNRASAGQVVQVRTLSGTVVSGIAQEDGTVLVSP